MSSDEMIGSLLLDDFEGASLVNPKFDREDRFFIEVQSKKDFGHQGSLETWICGGIRLDNPALNRETLRIRIPNGRPEAKLRATFSYDRRNWQPVPQQSSSFDFAVPCESGQKIVYFASFYPYFYSWRLEHDQCLVRSPFARVEVIGTSVHGRDLKLVTITDPSIPACEKHRAFIMSGLHGAETACLYAVEGILDFLISEQPRAQQMRRDVIWKIIPLLNVDAAAEGLDRRNAAGINLYFDWGPPNQPTDLSGYPEKSDPSIPPHGLTQPETLAAFQVISDFRPDACLDMHSWHFEGDGFWGPEPAGKSPETQILKEKIASRLDVKHWLEEDLKFASTPSLLRFFGSPAAQPELALSFDSQGRVKTPGSMRSQGVQIVQGFYDYLKKI